MRRSPNARRTRATTSCEVGPTGLLRTNRPSIDGTRDLVDERSPEFVDRAADRAACGVLVAAAAVLLGNRRNVDVAFRAHAHTIRVTLITLEEHDGRNLLHGQRLV